MIVSEYTDYVARFEYRQVMAVLGDAVRLIESLSHDPSANRATSSVGPSCWPGNMVSGAAASTTTTPR